jgi:hypothetical protein
MGYFLLFMGKAGICHGASSHRNNAGWHDVTDIGRPLSGSGYQYRGRDEMHRRVEVRMTSAMHGAQVDELLWRQAVAPWVAIEATGYDGKAQSWWTFFDVRSAGYSTGTDYDSPTKSSTSYIFEFGSARWGGRRLAGRRPHAGSEGRPRSPTRRRSRNQPGRDNPARADFPEALLGSDSIWAPYTPPAWGGFRSG